MTSFMEFMLSGCIKPIINGFMSVDFFGHLKLQNPDGKWWPLVYLYKQRVTLKTASAEDKTSELPRNFTIRQYI